MANNFKKRSLILAMGLALSAPLYAAEEEKQSDEEEKEGAQKMVIVGSRAAPRSIGDSPVPVDVISAEEMIQNGSTDMTSLMASVAPSFNVNEQPISDAATIVRPANLRGLPPDNTLILVNGKRRHRSAVITFLGGGISDGSQGPDVSVIPAIALKQVEILRDGASAQYGSDAIAGVINFVLKDNNEGVDLEARWGEYAEGDGGMTILAGNIGMPLSERGFANFSFEYKNQDATSRSLQRSDAAGLIEGGNTAVADPAQIWGSPEVKDDVKIFANLGLDLGDGAEAYMFGNYAKRTVDGGFFFRNPHTRSGVFSGDGGTSLLIGDLDPNDAVDCSAFDVPIPTDGSPVHLSAAYQAVPWAQYGVPNSGACWAFNELFPGGFTPRFGGTVVDTSIALGTKGTYSNGMNYDLSFTVGRNAVDFAIRNTVNASLGNLTPTEFEPGSYIQLEKALSYDISKEIESSMDLMTLSAGVEWRQDSFEIKPGDPDSYAVGPLGFNPVDSSSQGFGIGSNGFPGFKPEAAGVFSRSNIGVYLDLETYVNAEFMYNFALRHEDFSDFGSTTDAKLSAHWQADDYWAFRGSVSTGFRAPTIGQSKVINVTTQFGPNGLEDQATLPPTHPISVKKGGKPLAPEESTSFTLGAVWEQDDWFVTLDYFQIEVTDRISQTSALELTPQDIAELVADGVTDASSFSSVVYFTNDFDTTTTGVDLVVSRQTQLWGGDTSFNFAFNWTETQVDDFNPENINETKIAQLEENVPSERFTFTINHERDNWNWLNRINYYGSFLEAHLDEHNSDPANGPVGPALPIFGDSEFTLDTEFGYNVNDQLRLAVGAKNLFDEYPTENPWAFIVGAKYPPTSPMGFNGRFLYLKANYSF